MWNGVLAGFIGGPKDGQTMYVEPSPKIFVEEMVERWNWFNEEFDEGRRVSFRRICYYGHSLRNGGMVYSMTPEPPSHEEYLRFVYCNALMHDGLFSPTGRLERETTSARKRITERV